MTLANPVTTITRIECKRCNAPLGLESRESGFHFCHKCRICTVCKQPLSAAETVTALTELESVHIRCMSKVPPNSMGEITEDHLQYLNMFRLMISPDPNLNEKTNEDIASQTFNEWVQKSCPTADVMVLFLSKLESVMAECHRVMAQSMVRAKITISQRDQENKEQALQARLNPNSTPKTTIKITKTKVSRSARAQELLGMLDSKAGNTITVDETNDFLKMIASAAKLKMANDNLKKLL